MSVEKDGSTLLDEAKPKLFKLKCVTNINKNVSIQLSWTKNDKDLANLDGNLFSQYTLPESPFLNTVLQFNALKRSTIDKYRDTYRCKAIYPHPELGQGINYVSDSTKLKFSFIGNSTIFFL